MRTARRRCCRRARRRRRRRTAGRSIEADPRYVKAYLRRAAALLQLHEAEGAEEGAGSDRHAEDGAGALRERALADLRKVLVLEPHNKQAKADLERLTRPPPTTEELAAAAERARVEQARAEKEARRLARGARKLQVREAGEADIAVVRSRPVEPAPGSAAAAPGAAAAPSEAGGVEAAENAAPGRGEGRGRGRVGRGGRRGAEGKKVLSVEEAKALAAQARQAVIDKLAGAELQVPTSSGEFERGWKRVRRDPAALHAFLAAIPPGRFASLFRSGLEEEVLLSLFAAARDSFLPRGQAAAAAAMLRGVAAAPRLQMALRFLDRHERARLDALLDALADALGRPAVADIAAAYQPPAK